MLDYDEKRAFPRMQVECPAKVSLHGNTQARAAIVKNLSGGGMLMWLNQLVDAGSELDITVEPGTDLTPPLDARVRVLRCTRLAKGDGSFAVACRIEKMLG